MRTWNPLVLILALAACSGGGKDAVVDDDGTVPDGGDADTDSDSDSDTDADCTATVTGITPEDGNNLVPLDAEVTATFDVAITDSDPYEITVGAASGTTDLASDGLSMTWTGTLDPETEYTITASVCENSAVADIRSLPLPLDLTTLEGNTYAIPWRDIDISEPPPPAQTLLGAVITIDFVMAQILTVNTTTLLADSVGTTGVTNAAGDPEPQCDVAVLQTADFTLNPYFRIEGTISIPVDPANDVYTDVEDFSLLAKMDDGGGSISDIRIHGLIATEQILQLPDEDCVNGGIPQTLNATCLPCNTSTTGMCMLFDGTADLALLQPLLDIAGFCAL